jgi:arylsulfatase A-like enzyme
VCNPSRAALLSGKRPSTTGVYDNGQDFQPAIAPDITLLTQFLRAGYLVIGTGKIFHNNVHRDSEWSAYFVPKGGLKQLRAHPSAKDDGVGGIKFKPLVNEARLPDDAIVDYAIGKLKEKHDKPFFLAVGIHKPHMPWDVPQKYYDRFPLDTIELPPTKKGDLDDIPPAGIKMAKPQGDHAQILKSGRWKEAVQAYLASISYTDDLIGKLLEALDNSPYAENTIIVFWGDHGWHLGEKEHWRKFALWEEATRTPFIWVAPGTTKAGGMCQRTVDHMCVYPTLCDLCGIAIPKHVEGPSIRSLLLDPGAKWDQPALTTYHRNNHAVRTEKWRYIRYADGGEELYDHSKDPYEWTNLAKDSSYREVMADLGRHMPTVNVAELPRTKEKEKKK